jgi:hypothetical protein
MALVWQRWGLILECDEDNELGKIEDEAGTE